MSEETPAGTGSEKDANEAGAGEAGAGEAQDVEALRRERDELRGEVEKLQNRPAKRRRVRRVSAPILALITILVFAATVPAAWAHREFLNTDRYVAIVGPLASNPDVQQALARELTDEVFQALPIQQNIASALPPKAAFLSVPLTSAIKTFVHNQVLKVVQSQAFQKFWVSANRFVHSQVLAILNGNSQTVSIANGKVLLNLLPLVNLALKQIQSIASGLLPANVTIPTINVNEIPAEAVQKLNAALGTNLPTNFGAIAVYDSKDLEALQKGVRAFDRVVILLVILIPILIAVTLWVSIRRRRTLVELMTGFALVLVLERRLSIAALNDVVGKARPENRAAVQALTDQISHTLLVFTGWLLAIALIVLVIALVTGPYRWAVAMRRWFVDVGRAIVETASSPELAGSAGVAWIRGHRDLLMLGGAALAVILLLFVNLSFWGFFILAVIVAAYELVIFRLAGSEPEEEAAAADAGGG